MHLAIGECFPNGVMFHADDPEVDENIIFRDFFNLMIGAIEWSHGHLPIQIIISEATLVKHHGVLSCELNMRERSDVKIKISTISNDCSPAKTLLDQVNHQLRLCCLHTSFESYYSFIA